MTEYETAQLAISEYMRIQGLIGIAQTQGELIQNETVQYTTLAFGYLYFYVFKKFSLSSIQSISAFDNLQAPVYII
jgi:hypothetical protein